MNFKSCKPKDKDKEYHIARETTDSEWSLPSISAPARITERPKLTCLMTLQKTDGSWCSGVAASWPSTVQDFAALLQLVSWLNLPPDWGMSKILHLTWPWWLLWGGGSAQKNVLWRNLPNKVEGNLRLLTAVLIVMLIIVIHFIYSALFLLLEQIKTTPAVSKRSNLLVCSSK